LRRRFHFGLAAPLFCSILLFPQATSQTSRQSATPVHSASPTKLSVTDEADNPPAPQDIEALERKHAHEAENSDISDQLLPGGAIDILSDTMGVDFGPYLGIVRHRIRLNWYSLIPEVARAPIMRKGKVTIEFSILKDGHIGGLQRVESSGDLSMDRAAWG
jgi:outer membrane biosynthesis protein TonB